MNKYTEDILEKVDATYKLAGEDKDILQLYMFPYIDEIETDLTYHGVLKDPDTGCMVRIYTLSTRPDLVFGYAESDKEISIMLNMTPEDTEKILAGALKLLN